MTEQIFEFDFKVTYNITNEPTLDDVIISLKALKHLIPKGVSVVNKIRPDLHIKTTDIIVQDVEAGSLLERLKVKCAVGLVGEDNAKKLNTTLTEVVDDSVKNHNMLSKILYAGVGAVVTAGTITAIHSCSSKDTPIVNNYYDNSVSIAVLSENSDLTGEQVVEIVNSTMDKKTVQKSAEFIKPAKNDSNATIDIGDQQQASQFYEQIPTDIIEKTPEKVEFEPPQTKEKDHTKIDLFIHASDQDRATKGWGGIVPKLFSDRVTFELSNDIDPNSLHGHRQINADITVIEKYNKNTKQYKPSRVIIRHVNTIS